MGKKIQVLLGLAVLVLAAGCGSPEGRLAKAQALAAKGRQAEAARDFEAAVAKDQSWPRVGEDYLGLAQCRLALGDKDRALVAAGLALDRLVTEVPALEAGLLLGQGALEKPDLVLAVKAGVGLAMKAPKQPQTIEFLNRLLRLLTDETAKAMQKGLADKEKGLLRDLLTGCYELDTDLSLKSRAMVLSGFVPAYTRKDTLDKVDATKLTVANVATAPGFQVADFPYVTQISNNKLPSSDGRKLLWRDKDGLTYYLKISDADGKNLQVLKPCKNGFRPSWSPDGRKILYTAINWGRIERAIYIYDLDTQKVSQVFRSRKGLGALAAWSPEGSKIVFTYRQQLWVMNANGIGLSLLNINQTAKEAQLLAWSKDGTKLAYLPMGETNPLIVSLAMKP